MNTHKYKLTNQANVLREASREAYMDREHKEYRDCTSKSLIDFTKTHLNYNLCSHPQYTKEQIWEYMTVNTTVTPRIDSSFGSTIITLPKDFDGTAEEFFKTAYDGFKEIYHLTEEDVISAYVHMDETTPHMHFQFIPIYREGAYASVCWSKVIPYDMFTRQHSLLKEYMEAHLNKPCNILNGKTLNANITAFTKAQREEGVRLQKEIDLLREQKTALSTDIEDLMNHNRSLKQLVDEQDAKRLKAEEEMRSLKAKFDRLTNLINETMLQFKRFTKAILTDSQKEIVESNLQVLSDSVLALSKAQTNEEFEYGETLFNQAKDILDDIEIDR